MRGKLYRPAQAVSGARITHAGARKTVSVYPSAARASDHPRRCGENLIQPFNRRNAMGSPPQVRGKLRTGDYSYVAVRITPAGAGKTRTLTGSGIIRQDHPRRCGENWGFGFRFGRCLGSPPQVRGKLDSL